MDCQMYIYHFGELGEFVPKCCHTQTRQILSPGILLENLITLDLDLRTSVKFIFPDGFIYRKAKFKLQHLALTCKIRGSFYLSTRPTNNSKNSNFLVCVDLVE